MDPLFWKSNPQETMEWTFCKVIFSTLPAVYFFVLFFTFPHRWSPHHVPATGKGTEPFASYHEGGALSGN